MKCQQTSFTLRKAWLVMLLVVVSGGLHAAWQVDVYVNGSTEGPTMSFGEGAASVAPMPPFSSMYGVVDVYLANPGGVYPDGSSADIQEYYNRLSVDIKAAAATNRWVLVAGSNARLTWTVAEGEIPGNFKIAWTEKGTDKVEAVVAGATFSVKTGVTYTLGVGVGEADITNDPNNKTQHVGKDEGGQLETAVIKLDMPPIAASYTLSINLNAGMALLAFPVYDAAGELIGYRPNVGNDIQPADIANIAVWIIEVVAPGYDVALAWDQTNPNVLIATLTKNGRRADGDWLLSAQPSKTGLAPLAANAALTGIDGAAPAEETILGALIAIIKQFGTLDFDGNGVVNLDDATYLYNYAAGGMDPYATAEDIMAFTTAAATVEAAQVALDFFRENLSELYFDGTDEQVGVLLDNATYFYNFASGNFDEYATAADIQAFTTAAATDELAEQALATMREFLENAQ